MLEEESLADQAGGVAMASQENTLTHRAFSETKEPFSNVSSSRSGWGSGKNWGWGAQSPGEGGSALPGSSRALLHNTAVSHVVLHTKCVKRVELIVGVLTTVKIR